MSAPHLEEAEGRWRALVLLGVGPAIGIAAMWKLRKRPEAVRMANGHR